MQWLNDLNLLAQRRVDLRCVTTNLFNRLHAVERRSTVEVGADRRYDAW